MIFCKIGVLAQEVGTLNGKVTNLETKETIPFLNILLFNSTDSLAGKSYQSDVNGAFLIKNLALGTYTIRFSFVGYQTKTIKNILLSADRPDVDLGVVALNSDLTMLNEVVVEYIRPTVEVQDDKIVYNVDQSIFSEGSVATDILKNVPLVTVDIDGKATIAGKRNTRIFIDGKPSDYSASSIGELLSVLPSDALESIEVITDPSAKFDADGDGIINIVMKKGKKVGLSGNATSQVGTLGNHNSGVFLSKKDKKYAFTGNIGYNHSNTLNSGNSYRSNFFTDTTYNNQTNNNERMNDGLTARFGGNLDIDSAQSIKFSARGGFSDGQTVSLSDNFYLNNESAPRYNRQQKNKSGNSYLNYNLDFDYYLKLKNKSSYNLGLVYARNSSESDRDFSRYFYNPDGSLRSDPSLQLNDNQALGDNFDINLDYNTSFNFLRTKLEAGVKSAFNSSDEDQRAQTFDYNTGLYEVNPSLTNSFNFSQNVYSAYVSARFKINKWSLRAGNRAEITDVSFKQESGSSFSIKPYTNFFPSLSVNRSINNKYSLGLSYNKRISRPRQNALNPIIDDSDPQNLRFGNPDLSASITDQYELRFSVFNNNWSVSPRLSYAASSKIIERIKTVMADGNSVTTYQNLANSSSFSFNVFANYKASKNQNFNGSFTVSKIEYNSAVNAAYNRNGYNIKTNVGGNYSFGKKTFAELNIYYLKSTAAQGVSSGTVQTQFGVKRNMLKNKIAVRVTAVDPFTERSLTTITEGPNFYQESLNMRKTRNFLLSLSYRFTNIESKAKKD
ncbi:TonB-dependent receptor domain-containing protein [Pelobium manganitolerans]|uniref:TonB-dependent receptor domain-containing protein n=1 Tax=Pelobium manganitolerans TaxID=1842495 RepID=UPI003FA3481B